MEMDEGRGERIEVVIASFALVEGGHSKVETTKPSESNSTSR
jgi:hypothetical protein